MTPENWNSPFLDNGSLSTFPRKRIDAVTDELFEIMVSIRFASKLQKESSVQFKRVPRVEAGSNTSTVTLRVVGGDNREVSNVRQ
jgi:hypothetical protein